MLSIKKIITFSLIIVGDGVRYMRYFIVRYFVYFLLSMLLFVIVLIYTITVGINDDESCGVEASASLIHQNPWLILLEYYRRGVKIEYVCGATLISSKHAITAAHCVKKKKFTSLVARLGEYDTSKETDCVQDVCADPVILINVAEIIPHPDYTDRVQYTLQEYDIAVLKLKDRAPYTDFIRPICLPSGDLVPATIFVASGFGKIPILNYFSTTKKIIPLPNWNIDECQNAYGIYKVPQKIICAGGEENVDTCDGDSGGPLTWVKVTIELWGVTSAGNIYCGKEGSPGLYTKVIDYLDWIRTVVQT